MLQLPRRRRGGIRLIILGAVVATAAASVASSLTASAAVTSCTGIGSLAGDPNVNYGTCATDQNDGDGSVAFSTDGTSVTLRAKAKGGDEQVAAWWGSNGPLSVPATRICVAVDVKELNAKVGAAVEEQLILSYDGVQQDPLTWPVTTKGLQPAYCGSIPPDATNVWWQLITLAGASGKPGQARVAQTLVTVGYSS